MKRDTRTASALVLVGLGALALAGCAPDDALASGPLPQVTVDGVVLPNPCGLLSVDQAKEAMGLDAAGGTTVERQDGPGSSQCSWRGPDGAELPQVIVFVAVSPFTVAEQREAAESLYPTVEDADVPGAEGSFVTTKGQHLGMGVGPYWVMVTLVEDSDEDLTDATTELARIVAGGIAAG